MAWLNRGWRDREPVSVPIPSTGGSRYVEVNLPKHDALWDNLVDVHDIRFTRANGTTEVFHELVSSDIPNREMRVKIGDIDTTGAEDKLLRLCMYFSPADGFAHGAPSGGPITAVTGHEGYIEQAAPSTHIYLMRPPGPRASSPSRPLGKLTTDDIFVWLDPTDLLEPAARPYENHRDWEEPGLAEVEVRDASNAVVPALTDATELRWVVYRAKGKRRRRMALRVRFAPGSVGAFTLRPRFTTTVPGLVGTGHRDLTDAIGVRVVNPLET